MDAVDGFSDGLKNLSLRFISYMKGNLKQLLDFIRIFHIYPHALCQNQ